MRGQYNSRACVERDLLILWKMKELIQNKEITLETASEGGAIFCDRRYDTVFVYHNGAESCYAIRGFRGVLRFNAQSS